MKVVFICSNKDREALLAENFLLGVTKLGDEVEIVDKSPMKIGVPDGDVFCMVGVKSHKIFPLVREAGKQVLFFDKGYFRHRGETRTWEYWRIAVNAHHPTEYIAKAKHGPARWNRISRRRVDKHIRWRGYGLQIVYAGSSAKYHAFCGLPDPTEYARDVIAQIKAVSERPIVYRPKPTWMEAVPVQGSHYSPREESIADALKNAWCVVTNGSNACFDAVLQGVPCIVLGEGIAKPISSHSIADVENPYLATESQCSQWLANIAWTMFTEVEMASGLAWMALKPQLSGGIIDDSTIPDDLVVGRVKKPSKAHLKKAGLYDERRRKSGQPPI